MDTLPPPPAGEATRTIPPSSPAKLLLALPRVFSSLLLVAAATSIASTLAFIAYLALPALAGGQPRAHFSALYAVGIGGLAVAEGCQILGVLVLLGQWLARRDVEKKPRELAVLLVSLIPYMVVVIFLITLVVYLRARRLDRTSERTREAAQELKEQTVDTLIDAGANTTNTAAGSPSPLTATAAASHHVARRTMRDAVRQVVGPATGKSLSEAANGLVAVTMVGLLLATAATAGVVIPSGGLAPLQSGGTTAPAPTTLMGTWTFALYNCTEFYTQPSAHSGPCSATAAGGGSPVTVRQSGAQLTWTFGTASEFTQPSNFAPTGTIYGRDVSVSIDWSPEAGESCSELWGGTVEGADRIDGAFSSFCTGSSVSSGAQALWIATRNAP